jgi:hypothetical protein
MTRCPTLDPEPHGLCHLDRDTASHILANAFNDDDFHRYVLFTWQDCMGWELDYASLNHSFFSELLQELQSEGAICVNISGSPLAVVW